MESAGMMKMATGEGFPLRQGAGMGLDWFLVSTEASGGGTPDLLFSRMFLVYTSIYRQKKSIRGATRGPRGWGARLPPWACLPASWPPRCFLDVHSKSPGLHLFQKWFSRRFHSIWTPFDIPFLWNTKIGKKQQFWVGPPVNRLVPKIIWKCIIKPNMSKTEYNIAWNNKKL